jgi:hypothetical protein
MSGEGEQRQDSSSFKSGLSDTSNIGIDTFSSTLNDESFALLSSMLGGGGGGGIGGRRGESVIGTGDVVSDTFSTSGSLWLSTHNLQPNPNHLSSSSILSSSTSTSTSLLPSSFLSTPLQVENSESISGRIQHTSRVIGETSTTADHFLHDLLEDSNESITTIQNSTISSVGLRSISSSSSGSSSSNSNLGNRESSIITRDGRGNTGSQESTNNRLGFFSKGFK